MAEQREPGWYWITPEPGFKDINYWFLTPSGRGMWRYPFTEGSEIGERIPDNEELKALRAVAEAARRMPAAYPPLDEALARLGELK